MCRFLWGWLRAFSCGASLVMAVLVAKEAVVALWWAVFVDVALFAVFFYFTIEAHDRCVRHDREHAEWVVTGDELKDGGR